MVAVTLPKYPALHEQPEATLVPAEFVGHDTAKQRKETDSKQKNN